MPRQPIMLYKREGSNTWYVRWKENGKQFRLSTCTEDEAEAHRRAPAIIASKLSWQTLQGTTANYYQTPIHSIKGVGKYSINPPMTFQGTADGVKNLLNQAIQNEWAEYDDKKEEWVIRIPEIGDNVQSLPEGIQKITAILQGSNDIDQIKKFYNESVLQLYTDKKTALRFSSIWINFLIENNIKSWSQINEALLLTFKEWRKTTPLTNNNQKNLKPPKPIVINRHIKYLSNSFDLAVNQSFLRSNPIQFWKPDSYTPPEKESLKPAEIIEIFKDEVWQRDYLQNGKMKVPLGYKLLDILVVLFVSCKRRMEVLHLEISAINFQDSYVSYVETKNSSKGKTYNIQKAFFLPENLKPLLIRIIGQRVDGVLFPVSDSLKRDMKSTDMGYFNGDYFSAIFIECIKRHFPNKHATLHSLRHTATDILEQAGLSDDEIDAALGHHEVRTALPFYQDRSFIAKAKRLSGRTKKGIEVLAEFAKEFLK
ncbi:MAG: site-specific integrase [Fibrobacter sp.]|nr:site-specific integrase [Fibrobacter sp.]